LRFNPSLVIINSTGVDRLDWLAEGKTTNSKPSLLDINYHSYNVDDECLHNDPKAIVAEHPSYAPKYFSEPITGIAEHLDRHPITRLKAEPKDKLKKLVDHHASLSVDPFNRILANSLLVTMGKLLDNFGANYIILSDNIKLAQILPEQNILPINLADLALELPDSRGTGHISESGHIMVANHLQQHISKYNLY